MTKISLTPIIDVVFILLIFFMLASNFNKVGELDMNMSRESTQSSDDDIKILEIGNFDSKSGHRLGQLEEIIGIRTTRR